jgi:hypothetical protein
MKSILFIDNTPEPNGCTLYRNLIPADGLKSLGWEVHFLPVANFDFDVVVFSRMYNVETIKPIVERIRKETRAKIVYEADDLIDHIAPDNPFSATFTKEFTNSFQYFLREADMVTTTTGYLRDEMAKKTTKRIEVVPNSVREFKIREGAEKMPRICYTGSDTHFPDLDFVLDVILELQKTYDFEFVTQSIGPNEHFERTYWEYPEIMKPYISCVKKLAQIKNYKFVGNCHPFAYQDTLREMDVTIGLCPLHDDKFTRSKSAVKFYDWASVGTVTLASRCGVYEDCNFTAKNRFADWKVKLEALLTDEKLRASVLASQMQYVLEHRYIDVVRHLWDRAMTSVII